MKITAAKSINTERLLAWIEAISALILFPLLALVVAADSHSLSPAYFIFGVPLVGNAFFTSAKRLVSKGDAAATNNSFRSLDLFVVGAVMTAIIILSGSLIDRSLWKPETAPPRLLITYDYRNQPMDNTVLSKFLADCGSITRTKPDMHDVSGTLYARCGEYWPQRILFAAPSAELKPALEAWYNPKNEF